MVEHVAAGSAGGSFSATLQGGAIARVDDDATAFTGRAARFDLSADTGWDDAADDDRERDWVRGAMALVEPDAIEGRYANENADVGPDETRRDLRRCQGRPSRRAQADWDPDNVFRLNHNVEPAAT